jgi:putative SOS response-associated peptidase YedK
MRTNPSELARIFDAEIGDDAGAAFAATGPRYNVAPTQPIGVVVQRDDGRAIEMHRWGLVPSWATTPAAGARMINARAGSAASSPAFRTSFLRRRCIIPADGFYEWRREGRRKQPFLIHAADDRPLAFAGLWAPWRDPSTGEWLLSSAVVTTAANATVGQLHNRMPAVLERDAWRLWIDPDIRDPGLLGDLLVPARDAPLTLQPVSPLVNNANNEGSELLIAPEPEPDEPAPLTLFGG